MSTSAIVERIQALLDRTPPFDRLSDEERQDLMADISIQYFEPGEVVLEQRSTVHKGLYIVESGLVRLMDVDQQRLIDKCGEGDVFGSFGLIKGGSLIYEAKAVEPTVCAVLKGDRFLKLYDENEEFASFFNQDLRQYLHRLHTQLDVSGRHLLFNRRLHQLPQRDPVTCAPDLTARQAAQIMRRESIGSLIVAGNGKLLGILTDRDLRNKLVAAARPFETPISRIMSRPVHTISEEATLLDAMLTMMRVRVSRLAIVRREEDGSETLVGMLTDRDLAHFRGHDPVATLRRVNNSSSPAELASIRTEANEQLLHLYRQGIQPETLNAMISVLYDRLMVRLLELAERQMRAENGETRVDLPWAWMRLGNGGRQETALSSEKYGALIYANPRSEEETERAVQWFGELYERANASLESCGFKTSDDAAPDLPRVHPLRGWKKLYRTWIFEEEPEKLQWVPPFFDLRYVYGDRKLVEALKEDIVDALNVQAMDRERNFLGMLAEQALEQRPPLSFFRRFVLDRTGEHRSTLNIRMRGVRPVVDVARLMALELRYLESTNTYDRLRHAAEALPELADVLGPGLDAYQFIVDFRLAHQLRAVEADEPPSDRVDPSTLTRVQRNLLRTAFGAVADLQDMIARRYAVQRRWFRFSGDEKG